MMHQGLLPVLLSTSGTRSCLRAHQSTLFRSSPRCSRIVMVEPPSKFGPPLCLTAALVLLTLVGALVALRGSLRPIDPDQRAIIPAIESTAESRLAIGSIPDVILLRAALEQMPSAQGRSHQLSLNRYQLAPGAVQPVGGKTESGVGLDVFTVE